jgi:chromosome segregation ATPase
MPDDDKTKKGDDDKGKNRGAMTTEEIEAAAAKAAEILKKEDDDAKDKKGGDDDDANSGDDDLNIDPNNIDTEKTLKYIDKLKDENARRRIANKKSEKRLTALETQLADAQKALEAATEKLKDVDTKTAKQKEKEQTDLENALKQVEDLTGKVDTLSKDLAEKDVALANTNRRVMVQDRENMIERLVQEKGVKFSTGFERDGLIASLTKMEDGEFQKDNDEVVLDVMRFIKDAQANDTKTPGAGPGGRKTSTPIGDEIQALLKTKNLSPEQKARLDELTEMTGQTG